MLFNRRDPVIEPTVGMLVICRQILWDHFTEDLGIVLGNLPGSNVWRIYLPRTREIVTEISSYLRPVTSVYLGIGNS